MEIKYSILYLVVNSEQSNGMCFFIQSRINLQNSPPQDVVMDSGIDGFETRGRQTHGREVYNLWLTESPSEYARCLCVPVCKVVMVSEGLSPRILLALLWLVSVCNARWDGRFIWSCRTLNFCGSDPVEGTFMCLYVLFIIYIELAESFEILTVYFFSLCWEFASGNSSYFEFQYFIVLKSRREIKFKFSCFCNCGKKKCSLPT